jgi:hypothetical protein
MIATLGLALGACGLALGFALGLVVGTREMRQLRRDLAAIGRRRG